MPKPSTPSDEMLAALVTTPLSSFEGRDVLRAAIEIPGAAGGLREAMQFEPAEFHTGQELYVLLKTNVGKLRFDPIKANGDDTGTYTRVHVLDAAEATFVEAEFAEKYLSEHRARIAKLRDDARGIMQIPKTDEALVEEHEQGKHDELVDGCGPCEEERALADSGG